MADDQQARQDRGGLAAPSTGTLYEGRAARTHSHDSPLDYPTGPEYRDAAELQRICDQLPGTPLTLLHPADGLIRSGAQAHVVGRVVAARIDGDHVVASMMVTDAAAISAIATGTHELSLGYGCKLDADRFQRGVALDHLALVPAARCGPTCALRADCACQRGDEHREPLVIADPCNSRATVYPGDHMAAEPIAEKVVMDELQKQLNAAVADATAQRARADAADARALAAENAAKLADAREAEARRDAAAEKTSAQAAIEKARADAAADLEKARTDAAQAVERDVADRVAALTAANAILGATDKDNNPVDRSKMSTREIKGAVVQHVDGEEVAADALPQVVDIMFAGAVKRHAKAAGSHAGAQQAINQMRTDAAVNPLKTGLDGETAAQAALARRMSTAWMTPSEKE